MKLGAWVVIKTQYFMKGMLIQYSNQYIQISLNLN